MKTKTTIASLLIITVLSGGGIYYAQQSGQPNTQIMEIDKQNMSKATPRKSGSVRVANLPQPQAIPMASQAKALANNLAAMQESQKQRDAQVQAFRQTINVPGRLPELPVIEPLQMPVDLTTHSKLTDSFDANEGNTLPQGVMTKFTNETGLSRVEIEQAMNQ